MKVFEMPRRNVGRVLVTGGAGFIGSELVRQLVERGLQVVVVDNLVNGRRENLDGIDAAGMTLVVADVRDLPTVAPLLSDVDVVYHLACLGVRHSIHSPMQNHEVNATATLGLLQAAYDKDVPRFVYVSSSEVYGTAVETPISELTPTFPMTVYGGAKLAGECYARAFHRTYGYPATIVRPFNTFGPRSHHEGDSGEVIPKFMLRAMTGKPLVIFGDGLQTRDFLYVSDTARGIIACGESEAAIGETVNLGSGAEITICALADAVRRVVGREVVLTFEPQRPGDTLRLWSENAFASKLIGFKPETTFEDGLKKLLDWYMNSGQAPEALLEREQVHNWAI